MRILEGVKEKVENKGQYQAYLDELKPTIEELGELFVKDGQFILSDGYSEASTLRKSCTVKPTKCNHLISEGDAKHL